MRGADNAPAENFVALIEHERLPGRRSSLWRFEFNQQSIAFSLMYETVLIFLPISGFGTALQRQRLREIAHPMHVFNHGRLAHEIRMIMSLDDGQYIGVNIFCADIPRFSGASDIQAMTLTKGVKPQALMFAHGLSFRGAHLARLRGQIS